MIRLKSNAHIPGGYCDESAKDCDVTFHPIISHSLFHRQLPRRLMCYQMERWGQRALLSHSIQQQHL